jgi:hypothetical protein
MAAHAADAGSDGVHAEDGPAAALVSFRQSSGPPPIFCAHICPKRGSSKPPAEPLEETRDSNEVELGLKQFGERLVAETDGQPFYLVETLKVLLEEGMLLIRSGADGETVVEVGPAWRSQKSALRGLLPQSVREVIRARLSRLSAEASELVRAGAVLERGFDFESMVGVAGLEEAEGPRGRLH